MRSIVFVSSFVVVVATTGLAAAQEGMPAAAPPTAERSWIDTQVAAPEKALELGFSTAYTQGFGMLQGGVSLPDVATPGVGVGLAVSYRGSPRWQVGLEAQYQELTAERTDEVRGMTGTLVAQYHFRPTTTFDPWLEIGTGYRMLWEVRNGPAANGFTHGFELGRARVGADFHLSPETAIGPFVGADATVFAFDGSDAINETRLSTFIMAGIQARLDILGGTTAYAPALAAR